MHACIISRGSTNQWSKITNWATICFKMQKKTWHTSSKTRNHSKLTNRRSAVRRRTGSSFSTICFVEVDGIGKVGSTAPEGKWPEQRGKVAGLERRESWWKLLQFKWHEIEVDISTVKLVLLVDDCWKIHRKPKMRHERNEIITHLLSVLLSDPVYCSTTIRNLFTPVIYKVRWVFHNLKYFD